MSISLVSDVATAGSPDSTSEGYSSDWRTEALSSLCGSCTGRACTVCSVRTGDKTSPSGMPSGYAPKVLEYYNPTDNMVAAADSLIIGKLSVPNTADTRLNTADAGVSTLAASPQLNAIALENMKQGTPESVWLFDQSDPSIEGYAAQFTLDHGQTVDFKINTDATEYRIDIYRLGYYGGDGARLVDTINQNLTTAQIQPDPLFDPATKLVDAGNWSVSASWNVPGDAVSGVYIAELTRLDDGGQNMIPFIIRDDEDPSDITFQTSDTTWEAYNWWGGYNLYGGVDDAGRIGRADAVSYNRPIITRDGGFSAGPQDFLFGEEYPAIRYLEENGYDVNYISGIDTARDGAQLFNSKVFLSVGHDEYWSADQRANVEAARDAGVNLAFLSGNEVYWETRWEASIDGTGTPYKTLVSYKETWSNADTDPGNTTGTWRDTEFGAGNPENSLTGTIFTVDSYRLDTVTIPYDLSNFRFWSNTAVANIQPGQLYSLTPNLLGYEWDSDLDNGSRPDGLIDLSSTTVDVNTLLLDSGSTTGPGTATHSLTLYRAPSGALVFGAGTVYWSWGLDSHHDNESTPTDPNVQQAMVNLFADMGVQPETLMQSLAVATQSTDHTAPTSQITSPTATGSFTAAQPIIITGTAVDTGGGTVAVVEVSTDGGGSWHRATGFENWTYEWTPLAGGNYTILSRAVDDSVNMETPSAGSTITVAPASTATLFSPSDTPAILVDTDVGFVNLGLKFSSSQSGTIVGIRFYKSVGDGGTHIGSLWSSTGVLLASATFTQETAGGWQTVTFDNPVSITAGTTYVASYHSNGNFADTPDYFTTAHTNGPLTAPADNGYYTYSADNAFPTKPGDGANYFVDVIYSAVNAVNVPPIGVNDDGFFAAMNMPITIAASVLLANDTDPNGDILSISGIGASSGGVAIFNGADNTITFTPTPGFTGAASFGYAISDGHGGTSSALVSLTVVPPGSNLNLFSALETPAVLSDADAGQVNLGTRFVSSLDGTISGIRYYKGAGDTGTHVGTLWSSTGTLLATATFTNETSSGWQTVTFSNPVSITAGTTYVVSYHSNGHYTSTDDYFETDHVTGTLTAPASDNGVYTYSNSNVMPTSTFGATNYWVDVIFNTASAPVNHPPVAVTDNGFTTPQNNTLTIATSTLLANDTDPDGDTLRVTGAGVGINGTAGYFSNTNSVTFTPTPGYTGAASFTYAISDGQGGTATGTVNLTVVASADNPPVATNDSGFSTTQNTALSIPVASLLANDTDPDGDTLTVTGANGGVNGTAAFSSQTNTVIFTPNTGYIGPASFNYAISDGRGDSATGVVSLNVTAPPNHAPVATNDSGLGTAQNIALSIAASTLLANDTDQDGDTLTVTGIVAGGAINGTAAFDPQTNTITFTPTAGYTGPASFQYAISDGRGGTANATVSLNVNESAAGVGLFSGTDTPSTLSDVDAAQVNLGVKFVSSAAGTITGIRYYKGAGDTGVHTGSLWSSTGVLQATATFVNETASGWQTVTFSNPVSITAGTTYVASFHSNGHYTSTSGYFATDHVNGALIAAGSGNGLYAYSNSNVDPTSTFNATNYWVDVVFSSAPVVNQPPVAVNDNGFSTNQNTVMSIAASALLANDTDPNGDTLTVTGVSGGVNGVVSFNPATNIITFTPTTSYIGTASFNYAISDGHGGTASASVGLTVITPVNQPPVAVNDSGFSTAQNTPLTIAASALLANDTDLNGDTLTITGVSGGISGTASFNAQANTVTFTPMAGYTGPASFNYAISDGHGGAASANASLAVIDTSVTGLFTSNPTPSLVSVNDPNAVELGFKFQSSTAGQITGIRFYKGPSNTGTHIADLWSSTGTLLASATFTNETASGWQQVNFATPVAIAAGPTYIAAYHSNGNYSADPNLFANAVTHGPLTAPSSATSGGNGVYAYGSADLFPNNTYNSNGYGVDVLFRAQIV